MAIEREKIQIEYELEILREKLLESPELLKEVVRFTSSLPGFADIYTQKWALSGRVANALARAKVRPSHILSLSDEQIRSEIGALRSIGAGSVEKIIEAKHKMLALP